MEGLDAVDIISAAWQLLTARRDFHRARAQYIFPDRAAARFFCPVTFQKWDNLLTVATANSAFPSHCCCGCCKGKFQGQMKQHPFFLPNRQQVFRGIKGRWAITLLPNTPSEQLLSLTHAPSQTQSLAATLLALLPAGDTGQSQVHQPPCSRLSLHFLQTLLS